MEEREELTTADLAAGRADGGDGEIREDESGAEALLDDGETEKFQVRWREIQGDFVDQPREAVEEADRLVADLMQRLAAQFSETRSGLEQQWDREDDVSTEDLRVALTRYRSFFERLLSA